MNNPLSQLQRMIDAVSRVRARGHSPHFVGPQPETSVLQLEKMLGVSLPLDYKAFLLHFGLGGANGFEVCGLTSDIKQPAIWPSAYCAHQMALEDGLPSTYVLIGTDGADGRYCIDTARACVGNLYAPVVWCTLYPPHDVDEEWPSFTDYFVSMIEQ